MRRLLAIALLCLLPGSASAAVAHVQSNTQTDLGGLMWTTGSLDQTLTFAGAVTSGNTVVAWTLYGNLGRTMSCTHDGNAMTEVMSGNTANNMIVRIYARVATTTGTGVTCTISANDILSQQFTIAEFSGMAATLSTAGGAGVTPTTAAEITVGGTSHDSGADITPDTADNLFLGGAYWSGSPGTVGLDSFTAIGNDNAGVTGYRIQSSATAQDWVVTTTNSRTSEIGITNLDGAAGGGGGSTGHTRLLLTGVGGN